MKHMKKIMTFWNKHRFKINMTINVSILAFSLSFYLNEQYKDAYHALAFAVLFTLFDYVIERYLTNDEE